jgi:hypothetical protein
MLVTFEVDDAMISCLGEAMQGSGFCSLTGGCRWCVAGMAGLTDQPSVVHTVQVLHTLGQNIHDTTGATDRRSTNLERNQICYSTDWPRTVNHAHGRGTGTGHTALLR